MFLDEWSSSKMTQVDSFHPLDADDYTDMAYISDSEILFNAIVNNDVFKVKEWLAREDINVNCRDHCGRTPLHVAAMSSDSLEIFQALIGRGARMIARLQDGRTALHIAAARGQNDFVNALLRKSEANEEEKLEKEDKLRLAQKSQPNGQLEEVKENPMDIIISKSEEVDVSDSEDYVASEDCERTSAGHSFVKVKRKEKEAIDDSLVEENPEEPDIIDVNALDWYFD
ncbi:ankyrin repeat-containing domain protein [Tirmania nivea]|nr:ankyrin repeat-containing domain protein [Tirmania nivea]